MDGTNETKREKVQLFEAALEKKLEFVYENGIREDINDLTEEINSIPFEGSLSEEAALTLYSKLVKYLAITCSVSHRWQDDPAIHTPEQRILVLNDFLRTGNMARLVDIFVADSDWESDWHMDEEVSNIPTLHVLNNVRNNVLDSDVRAVIIAELTQELRNQLGIKLQTNLSDLTGELTKYRISVYLPNMADALYSYLVYKIPLIVLEQKANLSTTQAIQALCDLRELNLKTSIEFIQSVIEKISPRLEEDLASVDTRLFEKAEVMEAVYIATLLKQLNSLQDKLLT